MRTAILKNYIFIALTFYSLVGAADVAPNRCNWLFSPPRERSLREDIRETKLSGRGFTLLPNINRSNVETNRSPIYRELLTRWNLSKMMESHAPVSLGSLKDQGSFNRSTVSVLNMPIKFPGSEIRIPIELEQFRELLQKAIDHEAEINPEVNDFYIYITVDQNFVRKGSSHRRPGIHIDGVQGRRYPVKLPPEHMYSASNSVGTIFYDQVFDLRKLDPDKQHVHAELERQAKPESRMFTKDYELYLWDAYSVHETAIAQQDTNRTFVRVELSKKIYDDHGDTQNPLFDYNWPRVLRPIPADLDDRPLKKN